MANFNKVILLGNLTRDVELKYTQSGTAIGKFGMAINRKFASKDGGDAKETTCFVDLTVWGRQAELLNQYVNKGSQLFVEGRLEFSTWEAKEGGKRSKLEVVVENFQFVGAGGSRSGGGGGDGQRGRSAGPKEGEAGEASADYDGIPF